MKFSSTESQEIVLCSWTQKSFHSPLNSVPSTVTSGIFCIQPLNYCLNLHERQKLQKCTLTGAECDYWNHDGL